MRLIERLQHGMHEIRENHQMLTGFTRVIGEKNKRSLEIYNQAQIKNLLPQINQQISNEHPNLKISFVEMLGYPRISILRNLEPFGFSEYVIYRKKGIRRRVSGGYRGFKDWPKEPVVPVAELRWGKSGTNPEKDSYYYIKIAADGYEDQVRVIGEDGITYLYNQDWQDPDKVREAIVQASSKPLFHYSHGSPIPYI